MPRESRDYSHANRIAATPRGALTAAGGALPMSAGTTSSTRLGAQIIVDTTCPGCDYNLVGLRTGQHCPECGRIIAPRTSLHTMRETLVFAPLWYLRLLALGFGLLTAAALLLGAVTATAGVVFGASAVDSAIPSVLGRFNVHFVGQIASGVALFGAVAPWALLACALAWLIGLCIVALPRPRTDGDSRWSRRDPWVRLAIIALGLEFWWLPAAGLYFWLLGSSGSPTPTSPAAVAGIAFYACMGLGAAGLLVTAWHLSRFAEWATDTRLAHMFRAALGGIAFFGACLVAGRALPPAAGGLVFRAFEFMLLTCWAASVALLLWSVLCLFIVSLHALSYAKGSIARDQRLVEKMRAEAAAQAARAQTIPDWEPPDLTHRVGTPRR